MKDANEDYRVGVIKALSNPEVHFYCAMLWAIGYFVLQYFFCENHVLYLGCLMMSVFFQVLIGVRCLYDLIRGNI